MRIYRGPLGATNIASNHVPDVIPNKILFGWQSLFQFRLLDSLQRLFSLKFRRKRETLIAEHYVGVLIALVTNP